MNNWRDIGCDLLEKCLSEIKDKKNMQKIQSNVLDPLIDYILERLYPYFLVTSIIFLLILLMVILVFVMLLRSVGFWDSTTL
jgi:hypothetical protein